MAGSSVNITYTYTAVGIFTIMAYPTVIGLSGLNVSINTMTVNVNGKYKINCLFHLI
jgi:hypothetical protein